MTTRQDIYSIAEKDLHTIKNKDERDVLVKKYSILEVLTVVFFRDNTELKEMIIYYRQRTRDLNKELKKDIKVYKGRRTEYVSLHACANMGRMRNLSRGRGK